MKQSLLFKTTLLVFGLSLSPAQAGDRLSGSDTRSLLKQVTLKSILPIYQELDTNAQHLVATTKQFCEEPDNSGLVKTRNAWSATLSSWQQSSPLLFGPATEDSIDFTVYFHPVKKTVINGFLAKIDADPTLSVDSKMVDESGVGGQGLATVEYLLFDRDQSDADLLSAFTDSKTGKQHCEYLVAIETLLASNITTVRQAWEQGRGNYSEAFYNAGDGSAYFTESYQPLELLINRLYQAVQAVEIKKLGVPLGMAGGKKVKEHTYPYKLEAWRSGQSLNNVMNVLRGLERLLVDGGILDSLRDNKNEALASKLERQIKQLLATKLESNDLFDMLQNAPINATKFYEQVRGLSHDVSTGLAPALGIQLGFNQNDGD